MKQYDRIAAAIEFSLWQRFGNTDCIIHMKELTDFECQLALSQ